MIVKLALCFYKRLLVRLNIAIIAILIMVIIITITIIIAINALCSRIHVGGITSRRPPCATLTDGGRRSLSVTAAVATSTTTAGSPLLLRSHIRGRANIGGWREGDGWGRDR